MQRKASLHVIGCCSWPESREDTGRFWNDRSSSSMRYGASMGWQWIRTLFLQSSSRNIFIVLCQISNINFLIACWQEFPYDVSKGNALMLWQDLLLKLMSFGDFLMTCLTGIIVMMSLTEFSLFNASCLTENEYSQFVLHNLSHDLSSRSFLMSCLARTSSSPVIQTLGYGSSNNVVCIAPFQLSNLPFS